MSQSVEQPVIEPLEVEASEPDPEPEEDIEDVRETFDWFLSWI